jgi:hypothetical protein
VTAWEQAARVAAVVGWERFVVGRVPAPWWLRLRRAVCRCECHVPDPCAVPWDTFWDGTPKHHHRACCSAYVGTVNVGWSGMRWRR